MPLMDQAAQSYSSSAQSCMLLDHQEGGQKTQRPADQSKMAGEARQGQNKGGERTGRGWGGDGSRSGSEDGGFSSRGICWGMPEPPSNKAKLLLSAVVFLEGGWSTNFCKVTLPCKPLFSLAIAANPWGESNVSTLLTSY